MLLYVLSEVTVLDVVSTLCCMEGRYSAASANQLRGTIRHKKKKTSFLPHQLSTPKQKQHQKRKFGTFGPRLPFRTLALFFGGTIAASKTSSFFRLPAVIPIGTAACSSRCSADTASTLVFDDVIASTGEPSTLFGGFDLTSKHGNSSIPGTPIVSLSVRPVIAFLFPLSPWCFCPMDWPISRSCVLIANGSA